jgi:hypothetical protein
LNTDGAAGWRGHAPTLPVSGPRTHRRVFQESPCVRSYKARRPAGYRQPASRRPSGYHGPSSSPEPYNEYQHDLLQSGEAANTTCRTALLLARHARRFRISRTTVACRPFSRSPPSTTSASDLTDTTTPTEPAQARVAQ